MVSLVAQLEAQLGPEPNAVSAPARGPSDDPGDGLFTRANSVDTVSVLDWLGIPHQSTPRGVMAQCPGCKEDGALVGERGGLKCLHDRCKPYGVPTKDGFRLNADLVALVHNIDPKEAAKSICQRFGLDRQMKRGHPARAPQPDATAESGPEWEAPQREPGDDTDEILVDENGEVIELADAKPKPATERYGLYSIQSLLGMVYAELQKEKPRKGVPTGNEELDSALSGFRAGNITVLGAKRSMGKTSFSIHVADTAVTAGHGVLLLAGEDSAMMYGKRWMARRAGLNAMRVRDLDSTPEERVKAAQAFAAAPNKPFFLPVVGKSVEWMAKAIREIANETPIDLVIVDYLQCIRAEHRSFDRRNEVTHVLRTCKEAILGIGASGLILSQLKRTERVRPEIEDLKESGDIEDAADHVLLGFKEEAQNRDDPAVRKIIVAKNKDGPDELDDIVIPFDPATASFMANEGHVGRNRDFDDVGNDPFGDDWRNF